MNQDLIGQNFRHGRQIKILFILQMVLACAVLVIFAASVGSYHVGFTEICGYIADAILDRTPGSREGYHVVIDLRIPAILGAVGGGFALAVCGAAMQSMLKNPLADPYTIGISSGAGFGAAVAIILGFEILHGGGVVFNAFVFSMIPALIILSISRFKKASPTMMILCGVSLMFMFSAMTQMFMIIANPEDLSAVYRWMVGSLTGIDYTAIAIIMLVTVLGQGYIQTIANQLNVMGVGDESAKMLGVDVERKRLVILLVLTFMAATVVSFTGVIGFVGLVAPHIARTLIGADNRYLIPAQGLLGSLLLLASHLISITVISPQILPVGVITACIGGPLFMYLLLRGRKEVWS